MEVDYNVGRILDALEKAGIGNDTVVILSGDNAAGAASADWHGERAVRTDHGEAG